MRIGRHFWSRMATGLDCTDQQAVVTALLLASPRAWLPFLLSPRGSGMQLIRIHQEMLTALLLQAACKVPDRQTGRALFLPFSCLHPQDAKLGLPPSREVDS